MDKKEIIKNVSENVQDKELENVTHANKHPLLSITALVYIILKLAKLREGSNY